MGLARRAAAAPVNPGAIIKYFHAVALTLSGAVETDGAAMATPILGLSDVNTRPGEASMVMFRPASTGRNFTQLRRRDSRSAIEPQTLGAANGHCLFQFGAAAVAAPMYLPRFAATVLPLTAPVASVPRPPSMSIAAWCRKVNAGDGSDCKAWLGFRTTAVTSPSGPVPRIGLLGDGAGGYRYGSVNCPDGLAAGQNAAGDIDAGSVQPSDLIAPGAAWWHSRIKMIPAIDGQPGRWAAYHNGALVKVFDTVANFPRGWSAVNNDFQTIMAGFGAWADAGTGVVPVPCFYHLTVTIEDDWSV